MGGEDKACHAHSTRIAALQNQRFTAGYSGQYRYMYMYIMYHMYMCTKLVVYMY